MSNGSENIAEGFKDETPESDLDIIRKDILLMRAEIAELTSIASKALELIDAGKEELMPSIDKLLDNPMIKMLLGGGK